MGKTPGSRRSKIALKENPSDWLGFVRLTLSQEAKAEMLNACPNDIEVFSDQLMSLIEGGYKVTFTLHRGGNAINCTITGRAADCPNLGYSLSGWGPNFPFALHSVWWKTNVYCKGERWINRETFTQDFDEWG